MVKLQIITEPRILARSITYDDGISDCPFTVRINYAENDFKSGRVVVYPFDKERANTPFVDANLFLIKQNEFILAKTLAKSHKTNASIDFLSELALNFKKAGLLAKNGEEAIIVQISN